MSKQAERTSPEMVTDALAMYSRVADRMPEFVRLVHDITLEELKEGPKVSEEDAWKHVGQHVKDIFPVVMSDKRVLEMLPKVIDEYDRLPATPETRLRKGPDENSIGGWALGGGAVGGGLFIVIAWYCLSDVTAEPGESAAVPHLGPFC